MNKLDNLKKLHSINLIGGAKLQTPPDGYCLIVYQDLTPTEVARSNVDQFYIKYGNLSQKQVEAIGSTRRETTIFDSPTYPEYLFMMVIDYREYGQSKSSLYYRWKPYDLESIKYITRPNMVFNSGIAGCLTMGSGRSEASGSIGFSCKYRVGDSVKIANRTIRFANPFRDEYVVHKVGRISQILPLNSFGECYYNILFDDRTEGVEVSENFIQRYYNPGSASLSDSLSSVIDILQSPLASALVSDKSTLANLALLSNLNQTIGKTQTQSKLVANAQLVSSLFLPDNTQDVGDNPKLQEQVTKFYLEKTIKWLGSNPEFAKLKKQIKFVKSKKGIGYIYKILKSFIKKTHVNWYDLRSDDNYEDVKDYIREKLALL